MLILVNQYNLRGRTVLEASTVSSGVIEVDVNGQKNYITASKKACMLGRHNDLRVSTKLPEPLAELDQLPTRRSTILIRDDQGNLVESYREWTEAAQQVIGSPKRHETVLVPYVPEKEILDVDLHHIRKIASKKLNRK